MNEIIDEIRAVRATMSEPKPWENVHNRVEFANKTAHTGVDDRYDRANMLRAAAELVVAIEILDRYRGEESL